MLQSHRRAHARIAAGLFAGLGLQVGAWAVLIPELVASRGLNPAELGAALAVMAATSIGALAPIVPTALSLAGRNAPGRSATAVSFVTTIGYSAFVVGPPAVGALAGVTSLRTALIPVVASTAAIALLARRLP